MDQLKVWMECSNPDILLITETRLRKAIPNPEVNLSSYDRIRQDRSFNGRGWQSLPKNIFSALWPLLNPFLKSLIYLSFTSSYPTASLSQCQAVIALQQHQHVP